MKKRFANSLVAACVFLSAAGTSYQAQAQSDASALSAISALPVASVVIGGSAAAASVVAIPAALSAAGAVLVIKAVEVTARGTVYVLERMSDGARVSLEMLGHGVGAVSLAAGTVVAVSIIGAGIVLSAAGNAIAFVPNELGKALLHNERLTS